MSPDAVREGVESMLKRELAPQMIRARTLEKRELHRRALIGVAAVAGDAAHVREVLAGCERLVAGRPELELLSARTRLVGPEDD